MFIIEHAIWVIVVQSLETAGVEPSGHRNEVFPFVIEAAESKADQVSAIHEPSPIISITVVKFVIVPTDGVVSDLGLLFLFGFVLLLHLDMSSSSPTELVLFPKL